MTHVMALTPGTELVGDFRIERVLATMYRHLGIDPALTVNDHHGRPRHLLEIREPIPQLS